MSIKIDLENIVHGKDDQTNFRSHLIRLIFKADQQNKARLRTMYPNTVKAVEHYQVTGEILDLEDDISRPDLSQEQLEKLLEVFNTVLLPEFQRLQDQAKIVADLLGVAFRQVLKDYQKQRSRR